MSHYEDHNCDLKGPEECEEELEENGINMDEAEEIADKRCMCRV